MLQSLDNCVFQAINWESSVMNAGCADVRIRNHRTLPLAGLAAQPRLEKTSRPKIRLLVRLLLCAYRKGFYFVTVPVRFQFNFMLHPTG
jgi:hypothetical protein